MLNPWRLPIVEFLGEPEVGQFEMTLAIEQQVLGFEIAVDEAQGVQVVERWDDLGRIEQGRWHGEPAGVSQIREQFTAADVLEQHV